MRISHIKLLHYVKCSELKSLKQVNSRLTQQLAQFVSTLHQPWGITGSNPIELSQGIIIVIISACILCLPSSNIIDSNTNDSFHIKINLQKANPLLLNYCQQLECWVSTISESWSMLDRYPQSRRLHYTWQHGWVQVNIKQIKFIKRNQTVL